MLNPNSYTDAAFSRDAIARWGHLDEALSADEGLLHVQMGHLARLCTTSRSVAVDILGFLEALLNRNDVSLEIENAVAISFLELVEIETLGLANELPPKLQKVLAHPID